MNSSARVVTMIAALMIVVVLIGSWLRSESGDANGLGNGTAGTAAERPASSRTLGPKVDVRAFEDDNGSTATSWNPSVPWRALHEIEDVWNLEARLRELVDEPLERLETLAPPKELGPRETRLVAHAFRRALGGRLGAQRLANWSCGSDGFREALLHEVIVGAKPREISALFEAGVKLPLERLTRAQLAGLSALELTGSAFERLCLRLAAGEEEAEAIALVSIAPMAKLQSRGKGAVARPRSAVDAAKAVKAEVAAEPQLEAIPLTTAQRVRLVALLDEAQLLRLFERFRTVVQASNFPASYLDELLGELPRREIATLRELPTESLGDVRALHPHLDDLVLGIWLHLSCEDIIGWDEVYRSAVKNPHRMARGLSRLPAEEQLIWLGRLFELGVREERFPRTLQRMVERRLRALLAARFDSAPTRPRVEIRSEFLGEARQLAGIDCGGDWRLAVTGSLLALGLKSIGGKPRSALAPRVEVLPWAEIEALEERGRLDETGRELVMALGHFRSRDPRRDAELVSSEAQRKPRRFARLLAILRRYDRLPVELVAPMTGPCTELSSTHPDPQVRERCLGLALGALEEPEKIAACIRKATEGGGERSMHTAARVLGRRVRDGRLSADQLATLVADVARGAPERAAQTLISVLEDSLPGREPGGRHHAEALRSAFEKVLAGGGFSAAVKRRLDHLLGDLQESVERHRRRDRKSN